MGEPAYKKIQKYVKKLILSKKLKPGDLVPSEKNLCEEFGVTRMTARTALNNLATEGYITRQRGIGSIVLANGIYDNISAINGFTKELESKGYKPSNLLVGFEMMDSTEEVRKKLDLNEEEKVWQMKRIRLANDIRVSYMITYMPVRLFPDLTESHCEGSLYSYIEDICGYKIAIAEREVKAIISTEELEEYLGLNKKEALLYINQVCKLQNSEKFEFSHTYHYNYTLVLNAVSERM